MRLLPEDNVVSLILFLIIALCAVGVFFHYVPVGNVKAFGGAVDGFIALNLKIAGEYLMIVGGVVAGAAILAVAFYWIGKLALRWREWSRSR